MRGEARQNLIAITIGLTIVAIVAAFFFRPAVLLGAGGNAVAGSLGRIVPDGSELPGDHSRYQPRCDELDDSRFRCRVGYLDASGNGEFATYAIEVDGFGCWDGIAIGSSFAERKLDGCVWILDY